MNKNERLSIEHLKLVLAVTEGFENDLRGTGQLDSKKYPLRPVGDDAKKKYHFYRFDELRLTSLEDLGGGFMLFSPPCLVSSSLVVFFSFFFRRQGS